MPTITKRSVFRKHNSMAMSLPKAWTDYYGLHQGEAVKVTIDKDLHIGPNPSPEDKTLQLIYQGGNLVIHLPLIWVRNFNIRPGDKLEVIANGELIIRLIGDNHR